jgi:nifR3 family TIM-barrel protein
MAGVTDTVFRQFIREMGGCGLLMTEFTSADGALSRRDKKAKRYLTFDEAERPISAQLFGAKPATLADAARLIVDQGFDLVDLNLGCPAKKVTRCNGGSGLLKDLPLIKEILVAIREAVSIPFTIKFRAGWDENQIVFIELAKMAEDIGVDAVALHARTRMQGYSGQAHWLWIAELKQAVKIPVIGNGDVRTPEDAAAMVAETGCDAVMIGRAAASNPWLFKQIEEYTRTGKYHVATEAERYHMMRRYFGMLMEADYPDGIGKMKQFTTWFTHGVRNGSHLRAAIYHSKETAEIMTNVDRFFEEQLREPAEEPQPLTDQLRL